MTNAIIRRYSLIATLDDVDYSSKLFHSRLPLGEEIAEGGFERDAGVYQFVIGVDGAAGLAEAGSGLVQLLEIGLAESAGLGKELAGFFEAFEHRYLLEGEIDLGGIEDLHHDQFMAAIAQEAEGFFNLVKIIEEIGEDQHEAAVGEFLGKLLKDFAGMGFARARLLRKLLGDLFPLQRRIAGAEVAAEIIVENAEADGVLLLDGQIRQRRGDGGGVIEFGPSWGER